MFSHNTAIVPNSTRLFVFVFGAGLLFCATTASAQAGSLSEMVPGHSKAGKPLADYPGLLKGIELSSNQKDTAKVIVSAFHAKIGKMNEMHLSLSEQGRHVKELRGWEIAELRKILTEKQISVFDKNAEEVRAQDEKVFNSPPIRLDIPKES